MQAYTYYIFDYKHISPKNISSFPITASAMQILYQAIIKQRTSNDA